MLLCDRAALVDMLHVNYIEACEKQNPDLVERTLAAVSEEILDMLACRYPQPWPHVPGLVRYMAAVLSAYRVVEAITSLVSSEAGTDNEWIPLQKQWKYCTDLLADLAAGKAKLSLPTSQPDREEASVAVFSREPVFDLRGF